MKDSKIHPNSFIDDAINAEIKRLTRQETTMELIILHVMSDLPSNPRSGETTNFINENSKCQGDVNKVIRHQYIKKITILWFSYNGLRKTKPESSLPRPLSGQCLLVL